MTDPNGKFADSNSITIFRVDDLGDLTLQSEASAQIGDDFTINSHEPSVIGKQYDNVTDKVLPFSTGVPGPRSLRGRTTAYAPSLGGKTKK